MEMVLLVVDRGVKEVYRYMSVSEALEELERNPYPCAVVKANVVEEGKGFDSGFFSKEG